MWRNSPRSENYSANGFALPKVVLIPGSGMSQLVGRKTYDLAGNERGVWAQPATDRVFLETLRQYLPTGTISELPYHINDTAFADACVVEMLEMMATR